MPFFSCLRRTRWARIAAEDVCLSVGRGSGGHSADALSRQSRDNLGVYRHSPGGPRCGVFGIEHHARAFPFLGRRPGGGQAGGGLLAGPRSPYLDGVHLTVSMQPIREVPIIPPRPWRKMPGVRKRSQERSRIGWHKRCGLLMPQPCGGVRSPGPSGETRGMREVEYRRHRR